MYKIFLLITALLLHLNCLSQSINYYHLNLSQNQLKDELRSDTNYFSGGSTEYPYFQGKLNYTYIKFYRSTSTTCVIDLQSEKDFKSLIKEIKNKASFRFKFNTSYQEPVIYNYVTNNGNKVRFDLNQMRISIEYPSTISSLMDRNFGITPVFVCLSSNAYAFHTNLRCEGLGNCDTDLAKSNVQEAKKHNYRFCEICTTDNF